MESSTNITLRGVALAEDVLVSAWLQSKQSPATREQYQAGFARFLAFVMLPLARVTVADVLAYMDYLAGLGLGPVSRNKALAIIRSFYKFAMNTPSGIQYNPAACLSRAPDPRDPRPPGLDELVTLELLARVRDERARALLVFMYATGCRVSEAVGLLWSDVDVRENGVWAVVRGKGGKARVVPVHRAAWELMQGLPAQESGVVFGVNRHQALRRIKRAGRELGKHAYTHLLRHCCATHLLKAGARVDQVQVLLGHADPRTTMAYRDAIDGERITDILPLD